MTAQSHSDPIIAIATAPGRGGVGIVRLSAPQSASQALQTLAKNITGKDLQARHATYCAFSASNGAGIDQGLALWFPAPHSYTGESVLELQGHGGPVVMQLLLKQCLVLGAEMGLRMAQPGEFTQRAFLNGQLDLAQAESVADLIAASTEAAARAASHALQGAFSKEVHDLVYKLTHLRMLVEATLDFPEEEIEFLEQANAKGQLANIQMQLARVQATTKQGALLRDGLRVVLIGQPNVGKSSVLNALAGQDLAIVTPIAGTTRDTITQTVHLNGVPLELIDTAGLRDTTDEVERMGIARTWAAIAKAHVAIHLHDGSLAEYESAQHSAADAAIRKQLPPALPVLSVMNKSDLIPANTVNAANIANAAEAAGVWRISAKTGAGLDALKTELLRIAGWDAATGGEGVYIARERHIQALQAASAQLDAAADCANMGDQALDLFAECLRLAQNALGEITGEFTSDDLLGVIFSQFCIGK